MICALRFPEYAQHNHFHRGVGVAIPYGLRERHARASSPQRGGHLPVTLRVQWQPEGRRDDVALWGRGSA